MGFDFDPAEQANISAADFAQLCDEMAAQRRTRDELLAALESAVDTIEWMHGCTAPADDEVEKAIRAGLAAIDSAKGGAS